MPSKTFHVYKITNTETGLIYIGCTTQGFLKRFKGHFSTSRSKQRKNKRLSRFESIIIAYGVDCFSIELVSVHKSKIDMLKAERAAIIFHDSENEAKGYNTPNTFRENPFRKWVNKPVY